MTRVNVKINNSNIVAVDCLGHTGYADEGEDIVCAALSSVVQTAVLGLLTVAGINLNLIRDDEIGRLKFELPFTLTPDESRDAQVILKTMLAGVTDLSENWSKYIKLEVKSK